MKSVHQILWLATAVATAFLGGCGSSGPSTPNASPGVGATSTPAAGRGSVTVMVQFRSIGSGAAGASSRSPAANIHTRQAPGSVGASSGDSGTSGVPVGAQSVKVDITTDANGATSLAQSQVIGAPFPPAARESVASSAVIRATSRSAPTPQTVTFNNIPAGSAHIHAEAYNFQDPTNHPAVGLADSDITVIAGQNIQVTPVMTSTAKTIEVTATPADFAGNPKGTSTNPTATPVPVSSNGSASQLDSSMTVLYTATLYNSGHKELVGSPLVFSSSNTLILSVQTKNNNDPKTGFDPAVANGRPTVSGAFANNPPANGFITQIEVRDPNSGITFDFSQEVLISS